jgi:hypothetical protein
VKWLIVSGSDSSELIMKQTTNKQSGVTIFVNRFLKMSEYLWTPTAYQKGGDISDMVKKK